MKVLHVIESLERGGAERVLATLARALRHSVELHVVSLVGRGPLAEDLRLAGAQVYSLELRQRREVGRALAQLGRLVWRLRPDILHTHLRFSDVYSALVPRPAGTRLVSTFHNLGFDAGPLRAPDRLVRGAQRLGLKRRFDAFFAVSEESAASYRRHLGLDKVSVIYNPVDVERVRTFAAHRSSATIAERLRGEGRRVVVQVGSFRPVKGHDVALRALEACTPDARFAWVCVGDGPTRAETAARVQAANLGSWAHFVGEAGYDDTLGWLAEADVVIQPSRSEGVPLVLLEAMALGRPVVASRVGGIPEVVTDELSGLLVQPDSPDELLRGIQRVLGEEALARRLGVEGSKVVLREYDAPVIARHWLAAYEAVMAGG